MAKDKEGRGATAVYLRNYWQLIAAGRGGASFL